MSIAVQCNEPLPVAHAIEVEGAKRPVLSEVSRSLVEDWFHRFVGIGRGDQLKWSARATVRAQAALCSWQRASCRIWAA